MNPPLRRRTLTTALQVKYTDSCATLRASQIFHAKNVVLLPQKFVLPHASRKKYSAAHASDVSG